MAPALGGHGARATADEDDQVGLVEHGARLVAASVRADDAERERMPVKDRSLTADGGRDHRTDPLGQRRDLGARPGDHRTATADQKRPASARHRLERRPHRRRVRPRAPGGERAEILVRPDLRRVELSLLHVERYAEMHRARPTGRHLAKRPAHIARQGGSLLDHRVPLGQRTEQALLIELRQRVASARADAYVARDREQRHGRLVRLDDARQDVGRPAAAGPLAHADLPGHARVDVRHVGRRALVAGEHVTDRMVEPVQRVVERQARVAAQAEHDVHRMSLEHPHQCLGAGERVRLAHRASPSVVRAGMPSPIPRRA